MTATNQTIHTPQPVAIVSLAIYDKNYPPLLKEIYKPPQTLFYQGNPSILNKSCIAIVGTRKNTEYGQYVTEQIIKDLAILDIAIVSGLAKGIDTIAHKTALKYNLPTIAVLGSGLNNIYPQENTGLAQQIAKNGLIISEYVNNAPSLNYHFPQRNRIISGLSIAVIVTEAPEKSGALITANFALEQGRDIFVVPGDIDRHSSHGCIRLLQNGAAYPIISGKDIIQLLKKQPPLKLSLEPPLKLDSQTSTFQPQQQPQSAVSLYRLTCDEEQIFSHIPIARGISLDQIIKKLNSQSGGLPLSLMPISKILTILSLLEIKGLIISKDEKYRRK